MTVVAVMSASDGKAHLQAVVRPGPDGVEIDGPDETAEYLATLNIVRGDPAEPISMADGDDWIQALPWNMTGTYSWAEFISHGQRGEPLVAEDLPHRLDLFEADLQRHKLAPTTVSTYISHAKRMVRWTTQSPARLSGGLQALMADYEADVQSRDLAPLTVQTYLYGPAVFIRWLLGTYVPGEPTTVAADVDEDDSWMSEQETQARLVRWLEGNGWQDIEQSVGHQHGVDVTATKDGLRVAIEVKGHPQNRLIAGENKGAKRTFHPAAQARTYFANALHAILTTMHRQPDDLHVIALPAVPRYRSMVENARTPLERLGIGVIFVERHGEIETMLEPRQRGGTE
jgi:hypothetical protein